MATSRAPVCESVTNLRRLGPTGPDSQLHEHGPANAPIGDDPLALDAHRGHADAVRANRLAIAAVHAEIATVYDQLVTAEPSLAEEHRTQSDWHRNASEQARGYADLLNDHS
ncbi:hypothetical protein [Streptomyces canus]|uniref:hypothetical protein n=1 Tax=Streptomyces canus TaxID=58343 RepID=UPI002E2EF468|nr:hypothetical protein [Streptomyces canus]